MAYKMKGHSLPGIKQRESSPLKIPILPIVLAAAQMGMSAKKASDAKKAAQNQAAQDAKSEGEAGMNVGGGKKTDVASLRK
jgi:hypothetical protein